MEKIVHKFRTALGGFRREDVLNYITKTDQAHARALEEVNREMERERQARQELEEQLSGLRTEHGSAAAEEARMRASLEETTMTLARVRGELVQAEQELAAVRRELSTRQEQVAQLEPLARKYEELKDRVATVELDAHRKAQATVDEANAQAEELRGQTRDWLRGVTEEYDCLRREMDEVSGHAQSISRLMERVRQADERLASLKERGGVE